MANQAKIRTQNGRFYGQSAKFGPFAKMARNLSHFCKGSTLCTLAIKLLILSTGFSLNSMDGCGIYSCCLLIPKSGMKQQELAENMANFLKGTQNGRFWPKCKGGTLCKNLEIGHFFGHTLKGYKIVNTRRVLV